MKIVRLEWNIGMVDDQLLHESGFRQETCGRRGRHYDATHFAPDTFIQMHCSLGFSQGNEKKNRNFKVRRGNEVFQPFLVLLRLFIRFLSHPFEM